MNKNNDIINKFLLVDDKFIPETHLYQPKIGKFSACVVLLMHFKAFQTIQKENQIKYG